MNRDELAAYRARFENELVHDILRYWMRYAVERGGDGFYGAVDLQNQPVLTANKACVLNARILWTFSAAAAKYGDAAYAEMARRAYHVLTTYFADDTHGGFFMELTPDNRPADTTKHTYAQAFALYALCKHYAFEPAPARLRYIQDLFHLLEAKTADASNFGYREAFTRDWQLLGKNRMADHDEPKTMNTHLHALEAYSALYQVWRAPEVQTRLRSLLLLFLDKIIRPSGHLGIFFDDAMEEAKASRGICSFGHDVEASWLLLDAAENLGDPIIVERMRAVSLRMLNAVERVGFDKDGGMFLESSREGSHLRTNKHWWIQAETLVGMMNAFELTHDPRYWENVKLCWDFVDRHVIDHARGEWFTKVNRLGKPFLIEPADDPSPYYRNDWKIDPWKCPYHNGRACLELVCRIDALMDKIKNDSRMELV